MNRDTSHEAASGGSGSSECECESRASTSKSPNSERTRDCCLSEAPGDCGRGKLFPLLATALCLGGEARRAAGATDTGLPSQDDSDEFFKVKHGVKVACVGGVYERKLE